MGRAPLGRGLGARCAEQLLRLDLKFGMMTMTISGLHYSGT
jgi:hypothetical protein